MELEDLRRLIEGGIPFLRKVAVKVHELTPHRVRLHFPHDPANDNYVGLTHAAAIFAFGETCAGAAAGAAFDLTRFRLLARRASIAYLKPVTGALTSTIEIAPDIVAAVEQAVERDGKATVPVTVTMADDAGEMVAEMTVEYHFRSVR